MLQACLNGGRRPDEAPAVPVTPEALAAEARAAGGAGAACLHLHPRDGEGRETLAPEPVAAALRAVRAAVPGVAVGVGTGEWIAPGGRARQAHIAAWTERPDYASVNLREPDAPEVVALLRSLGVPVEAGLWSVADARRFLSEIDPADCLRILVEMPDTDPEAALAEARAILAILSEAGSRLPVLLHGLGASAWPCIEEAARRGLDTRVGLEDTVVLPDGAPAPGNAALVRAALATRPAA